MDDDIDAAVRGSLLRGLGVAQATVVSGPGTGRRMLIWRAGHTRGGLGQPRLNQRAALYAETLFEKGPKNQRKRFDAQGGTVEVDFAFHLPEPR